MKCIHCKKSGEDFQIHTRKSYKDKDYIYYSCRECNTSRAREYRKTASGKRAVARAVRKYEEKNKVKRTAWGKAKIISSQPCEICGHLNTHRHHEDYNEPTKVVFLCPMHHKKLHSEMIQ